MIRNVTTYLKDTYNIILESFFHNCTQNGNRITKPNVYCHLYFRFFTGENVWSAYVNITKCRIKSDTLTPGQYGGGGIRGRGSRVAGGQRDGNMREACPLRISVAPRRPPNYMDPKTR